MKTKLFTALAIVLFAGLAIWSYTTQQNKLQLQNVELKSRETKIKTLDLKYKKLDTELDKLKSDKNASEERVKQLEAERQKLESEKNDLNAQLQAKLEQKSKLAQASAQVVNTVTNTRTASAASGNQCSLVNNYAWDKRTAYAVCMAESGGNTNAANMNDNHGRCRGSFGLMQLACLHSSRGDIYSANGNMAIAYQLWSEQGWGIWGAYSSGAYTRYM